jgi:heat shock protein HspQ
MNNPINQQIAFNVERSLKFAIGSDVRGQNFGLLGVIVVTVEHIFEHN